MVSLAEKLYEEGREVGRKEGIEEVRNEIQEKFLQVVLLLQQKRDVEEITKLTGFSVKHIIKIESLLSS